jgi:hypothetical protein
MSDVVVTVEIEADLYQLLLSAANEMGVTPADLAGAIVYNYVRENYGTV